MSGLPDEWRALLESSDITKDEVIKNGDAVINALAYQFKQEPIPTAKEMMDVDAMLFQEFPESLQYVLSFN